MPAYRHHELAPKITRAGNLCALCSRRLSSAKYRADCCRGYGASSGAYGDEVARTPNIDQLANEGVRFTHTFAAAGVCAPNRSALITGVYPQSMGTQQMRTSQMKYEAVPPASVKAFPELLRLAGYATPTRPKPTINSASPSRSGMPM